MINFVVILRFIWIQKILNGENVNQYKKFNIVKDMLESVDAFFNSGSGVVDTEVLKRAILLAAFAHSDQTRNDKEEPYISHPFAVAKNILKDVKEKYNYENVSGAHKDPMLLHLTVIAVLHDVLEDTGVTIIDLEKEFDKSIVTCVHQLSNFYEPFSKVEDSEVRMDEKIRNLYYHFHGMSFSSKIVKTYDIDHNLNSVINEESAKKLANSKIKITRADRHVRKAEAWVEWMKEDCNIALNTRMNMIAVNRLKASIKRWKSGG